LSCLVYAFEDPTLAAALDLDQDHRRFALAYRVRAVTPGDYRLPAVVLEDMYKPVWFKSR
jgi:uncharacterized protein YfaS (alpha-2-macroglobulin family)